MKTSTNSNGQTRKHARKRVQTRDRKLLMAALRLWELKHNIES